jgi:hypothetical protein
MEPMMLTEFRLWAKELLLVIFLGRRDIVVQRLVLALVPQE